MASITSCAAAVFGARRAQPGTHGTILFIMCLGVLVAQLDSSVVNLALQPISRDLGASVSQLQWVVDSYNLVYATLLLTGASWATSMDARASSRAGSRSSSSAR
jgi:MFS family permease